MSPSQKKAFYLLVKRILILFLYVLMSNYLIKRLPRDSWISAIVSFRSIDSQERFATAAALLRKTNCHKVLDVGSGSASPFRDMGFKVLSVDIRNDKYLDVRASATHLPFRSNTFDCVTALDIIEHISYNERGKALAEMKRCGNKVIIHTPLQDGETFLGRVGDLAMLDICRKLSSTVEQNTLEHVTRGEPSPDFLETHHFKLVRPDWNLNLWLAFMKPTFIFFGLVSPLVTILYLLVLRRVKHPPYYGGFFIYEQDSQESLSEPI